MRNAILVGHTKCGTASIDRSVKRTGRIAVYGPTEIRTHDPTDLIADAGDRPIWAYHQNAVHHPEYIEKLLTLNPTKAFVIYRNPLDAALSHVGQVLMGRAGPVNVGLHNAQIMVSATTLRNAYSEFRRGALRDVISCHYDYERTARTIAEHIPPHLIHSYVFEDYIIGHTSLFSDLSDALGVTVTPLTHKFNATYIPYNRFLYKFTSWSYHKLTGEDLSIPRHAATDGGSSSIWTLAYRLNQRRNTSVLTKRQRRRLLDDLPFNRDAFESWSGLTPRWD